MVYAIVSGFSLRNFVLKKQKMRARKNDLLKGESHFLIWNSAKRKLVHNTIIEKKGRVIRHKLICFSYYFKTFMITKIINLKTKSQQPRFSIHKYNKCLLVTYTIIEYIYIYMKLSPIIIPILGFLKNITCNQSS